MQFPFCLMSLIMGLHNRQKAVSLGEKCTKACLEQVTFAITVFQNAKSLCGQVPHAVICIRLQRLGLNLKGKLVSVSFSQLSQLPCVCRRSYTLRS